MRAGIIVALMCGVGCGVWSGCGDKLPSELRGDTETALSELKQSLADRQKQRQGHLDRLAKSGLKGNPWLRARHKELAEVAGDLEVAQKTARKLRKLLKRNDRRDRREVRKLILGLKRQRGYLVRSLDEIGGRIDAFLLARKALPARSKASFARAAKLEGVPSEKVRKAVLAAAAKHPGSKARLMERLNQLATQAKEGLKVVTMLRKETSGNRVRYVRALDRLKQLDVLVKQVVTSEATLVEGLSALQTSEDLILVDMDRTYPKFRHRYRRVTGCTEVLTEWREVSHDLYRKHDAHLGMTIYSKPRGVLPEDAVRVASPPGFNYLGNPVYGRWKGSKWVRKHWVFHKTWACLEKIFWGPRYKPVEHTEFMTFQAKLRQSQVYFGPGGMQGQVYGTRGSLAPTLYKTYYRRRAATQRATGSSRTGGYGRSSYGGYGK